ncbi:Ig-like domain-containing protein [Bacteroidales bacterium]|nr:Ig-like domain-containing protein [Bacteroidales bacterium]
MRRFWREYFFKVILALVVIQLGVFAWLQHRNHKPIAQVDEASVYEGQSVNIKPLRNDTDKDEDELSLYTVVDPLHGTIDTSDNRITYTAIKGFVGVDSFAYTVFDGKKASKVNFIKITVNENFAPTANNDITFTYQGSDAKIPVTGNDIDKEKDKISIASYTEPSKGTLVKDGNVFVYAPNNTSVKVDSFTYTLNDGFTLSKPASVIINIKSKSSSDYPWMAHEIGNTNLKGSFKKAGSKVTMTASGQDIWNQNDQFHFAYQLIEGDFEIVARVHLPEHTNDWAKAGLMVRPSLSPNSDNSFIGQTANQGSFFQTRNEVGQNTNINQRFEKNRNPHWLKITRKGNTLGIYHAWNPKKWQTFFEGEDKDLPASLYVGFAATSHDNEKLTTVEFTDVKFSTSN